MWWSSEFQHRLRPLPPGAVRLTFPKVPNVNIGVHVPGLLRRLQSLGKKTVSVTFEVTCKSREVAWHRVHAIEGQEVGAVTDAWEERVGEYGDVMPFDGACD